MATDQDVARFRLPVRVDDLGKLHDLMVRMYGKALTVKQEGEWLVVFRGKTPQRS